MIMIMVAFLGSELCSGLGLVFVFVFILHALQLYLSVLHSVFKVIRKTKLNKMTALGFRFS